MYSQDVRKDEDYSIDYAGIERGLLQLLHLSAIFSGVWYSTPPCPPKVERDTLVAPHYKVHTYPSGDRNLRIPREVSDT